MLKIKGLSFRYQESENKILNNIDLEIKNGEFVGICGDNGSGKSTLAKIITQIYAKGKEDDIPYVIEGEIQGNSSTGLIMQNPDNQIISSVVEEDVAFGPENLGVPSDEIHARVEECLIAVDMLKYKRKAPHLLSGGQKQRVAIAGILAMQPEIIILDEPTAMLDPKGRDQILNIIKKLHAQGKTIILITHDVDELTLAQRIIELKDGEIIADNSPLEYFANKKENLPVIIDLCRKSNIPDTLDEKDLKNISYKYEPQSHDSKLKNDKIIQASSLSYCYNPNFPDKEFAVKDINLSVHQNEIFGIIGHTGSGKSTLIQIFANLMKPTSGAIEVKEKVGMVFQYPEHQIFEETVFKEIAYGPKNFGEKDIESCVKEAAKLMDIENLLEKSPFTLSGGQKRRVAIASILSMNTPILIFDEPTAGLDHHSRKIFLELLKSLQKQGKTIIIISHNMNDIESICSRVAVMDNGNLLYCDSPEEIFKKPEVAPPEMIRLLNKTKEIKIC